MQRIFPRLSRYFIVLDVLFKYGYKVLRHYFFGGKKPFISPEELRKILEELGGSFLKFGQMVAVRPDYFPREYSKELLKLLDEVPGIDPEYLDEIFLGEYGKKPEEIFSGFSRQPISAASFGQVHVGWLQRPGKEDPEKVAIKIQRPFVAENFALDAKFFSFLGWLLKRTGVVKVIDPEKVVVEFIRWTERELDYIREAENLARLRDQALRQEFRIKIPKVYGDLTTKKILVMEFIEGESVKSYYLKDNPPENALEIFKEGIFFEMYSFIFEGFFHADPHPANLIITDDGQLAFVDAGITLDVKVSDRKKLGTFIRAVASRDVAACSSAFLAMSKVPYLDILNEAKESYPQHWMKVQLLKTIFMKKVREGLADLIARWHKAADQGGILIEKSPIHKLMEVFQLAEKAGIRMPESGVLFARTFATIDIVALELIPNLNIPKIINEFFIRYKSEFLKLLELPDEMPFYMEPDLDSEWADHVKSFDAEIKASERQLLSERASAIMEAFDIS